MMVNARTERQRWWSFRATAADHARSVQSRLKKAMTEARLDGEIPTGGCSHIAIIAGSGSGKTVLLSSWIRLAVEHELRRTA